MNVDVEIACEELLRPRMGARCLPALWVSHKDLDRVSPRGNRLRERIGVVVTGADMDTEPWDRHVDGA